MGAVFISDESKVIVKAMFDGAEDAFSAFDVIGYMYDAEANTSYPMVRTREGGVRRYKSDWHGVTVARWDGFVPGGYGTWRDGHPLEAIPEEVRAQAVAAARADYDAQSERWDLLHRVKVVEDARRKTKGNSAVRNVLRASGVKTVDHLSTSQLKVFLAALGTEEVDGV